MFPDTVVVVVHFVFIVHISDGKKYGVHVVQITRGIQAEGAEDKKWKLCC